MFIKKLTFNYGNFLIFEDFCFESNHKFIVIKGPSGCGKTTLLKLISGNLNPFFLESMKEFATISMIIQEDALFPWLSGINNIKKILNLSHEKILNHSLYPHVETFINKLSCEMSYGQRRLIELFRVFLYKPKLLCLDEPFNFLDPKSRNQVALMLNKYISEQADCTIIMSSHYNEDIVDLNSDIYYFDGNFPVKKLIPLKNYEKKN